jgi:thioredoxin reductase
MDMDFDWDCIIVGAGPAGLSAALTLGRARRQVLVLDSGEPRNYAARAMHGVLGHDGLDPAALRARGRQEIAQGFGAIYGISAHTCPYCDGWEHRDERIAVLASGEFAVHLGRMLRQWSSDVVVVGDGGPGPDAEDEAALAAIGVAVVREPVERFVAQDGRLTAIELTGRPPLERDALFFNVGLEPRTALAAGLGCALDEGGFVIAAEQDRQTSVDRVYAAGNCADPKQNVPMAIGDGARAAVAVNARLVGEGVLQPHAAPLG